MSMWLESSNQSLERKRRVPGALVALAKAHLVRRQSGGFHFAREQRSGERLRAFLLLAQPLARRRDVERAQVLAAEGRLRHVGTRQADFVELLALRRVARHRPATIE